jgi:hypothetical protein
VKFKKIDSKNDRWSIKIKDITNIFKNEKQEYLALRIAKRVDKKKYDLIIINSDDSNEMDKLNEHIINAALIYDIINLTGHPVLFMPKWSRLKQLQNILHPFNHFTDTIIEFEQMLPLIKLFNSKIHLLGIMNISSREVTREYYNALYAVNNYYEKNRINVRSKFINHNVESDTILAYASIIQADLIYNPIMRNKSSQIGQINSTWEQMIVRSDIPLYNYFC